MSDGRVLADRYEVESLVGHGGMADVYLAKDLRLGRRVAVKVLSPQFARDETFVARFQREAQAAASLNHPNVVSVYDAETQNGTHFIVMEFVDGKTLAEILRERGRIRPQQAAGVAEAVARALGVAHAAGIVHRDVKPGNIMITPRGEVKVTDFGIARASASDALTQTATVLGTASYLSPEQAQGGAVDARSDLYSLGVVLYEMLTGKPPFNGESAVTIAYRHVGETPVGPSQVQSDGPSELDGVVIRRLDRTPGDRSRSGGQPPADPRLAHGHDHPAHAGGRAERGRAHARPRHGRRQDHGAPGAVRRTDSMVDPGPHRRRGPGPGGRGAYPPQPVA